MKNIAPFLLLITFLLTHLTSYANEKSEKDFYQVDNKNTILILKEKTNYFKRLPANRFFVDNLKWSTDLESKIKKDLSFYHVVSKEISETVSSKALHTISKVIDKEQPKVVVIALGENDGLFSKTIGEIRQYLAAIINIAQNKKAQVILVGNQLPLHYGLKYTNSFVKIYAQLAQQYDIAFVPEDKISYTYPLFMYSYIAYPYQQQIKAKSSDKIWQEIDKIISKEKQDNAKLPNFYRYPNMWLGA